MEANLQAYEKDMIRELRQAGVLVSDTQSVVGGLGFLALHNSGCRCGLNPPASRSARAM